MCVTVLIHALCCCFNISVVRVRVIVACRAFVPLYLIPVSGCLWSYAILSFSPLPLSLSPFSHSPYYAVILNLNVLPQKETKHNAAKSAQSKTKQSVFVVHQTDYQEKPGNMFLEVIGVYTKWEDAMKGATKLLGYEWCDRWVEQNDYADCDWPEFKIPKTKQELEAVLPDDVAKDLVVFIAGHSAQWWHGAERGATLTSISIQNVDHPNYPY